MQIKCEGPCEHGIASFFCHSDGCFLCSTCDLEVHSNMITQRHVRVAALSAPPWAISEARSKGIVMKEANHEAWGDSGPIVDPFPSRPVPETHQQSRGGRGGGDYSSAPERTAFLVTTSVASGDVPSNGNSTGSACHPGDAQCAGSNETDPNIARNGSVNLSQHQLQTGISSRFSSPGQASNPGAQNLTNALGNNQRFSHLESMEDMDVSDLIPPGALDMAQHMDNSVHGHPSESGQLANLFDLFGLPNGEGSQHGSVHQGSTWQQQQQQLQQQEDRMMLDVLLSGGGGSEPQLQRQRPNPAPYPPSSGLLSAAFNPRPTAKSYDAFGPSSTLSPFLLPNNDPRAPSFQQTTRDPPFLRPSNPLATCQSVHEGGLYAAAAACHDGSAYAAIMNGGHARGMNLGGVSMVPLSRSKRTSSSGFHAGNPAVSASYSLGRQPSSLSLAAAAAAAEAGGGQAGGAFSLGGSGSLRQKATFGSLNSNRLEAAGGSQAGRESGVSETHSEVAVRGGSLYLSTVASAGGGQKRVLDLNLVPPPSIGYKSSQPRNPGSFRGSLNGSLDIPFSLQDPPLASPGCQSMDETPKSKALYSTLTTSPSMNRSNNNLAMPGYPSQDQMRRGLSIDGSKGMSMEQMYGRFQSHNPPGALSAYLDQPDLLFPNMNQPPMLNRSNSSYMIPLHENQTSDRLKQQFPIGGMGAKVMDADRTTQLNRYRLKKINRLKAYAQDSLQEKKVRQTSRQVRARAGSGRFGGSRDDESAFTNGTGTLPSPDVSSENKGKEAKGDEDTSRIRHEISMIHLGYSSQAGYSSRAGGVLNGQITDRELHELGMSLAGPNPCSVAPGGGAPLSWPESNVIPEETLLGTSPPLLLRPTDGLLMNEVEDKADSLPHDTTDLLDAILSDNFNPSDLLL